jgi:hypothetical protein
VNLFDGRYTYFRAPASRQNTPLHQHFLMPTAYHRRFSAADLQEAELGHFLRYAGCPVLRIPDRAPLEPDSELGQTMLFDIQEDPEQRHNLAGTAAETACAERLAGAMRKADAPAEQFLRLGLE